MTDWIGVLRLRFATPVLSLVEGLRTNGDGSVPFVRPQDRRSEAKSKDANRRTPNGGYAPVLSIPIIDEHHTAINSENDDIINVLQAAFHAEVVLQLIEAPGFLADKDDESTVVPRIGATVLEQREAQVEGRMKRKMLALRKAFRGRRREGHHERRPSGASGP